MSAGILDGLLTITKENWGNDPKNLIPVPKQEDANINKMGTPISYNDNYQSNYESVISPLVKQMNQQGMFIGTQKQIETQKTSLLDEIGKLIGTVAQGAQSVLGEQVLPQVQSAAGYTGMAFPKSEFGGLGQAWKTKLEQKQLEDKTMLDYKKQLLLEQSKSPTYKDVELLVDGIPRSGSFVNGRYFIGSQDVTDIAQPIPKKEGGGANIAEIGKNQRAAATFLNGYTKELAKLQQDAIARRKNILNVQQGLLNGDSTLVDSFRPLIAYAQGQSKVLSDMEQKMQLSPADIAGRLKLKASLISKGKLDNETRQQLTEFLKILDDNNAAGYYDEVSAIGEGKKIAGIDIGVREDQVDAIASAYKLPQSPFANQLPKLVPGTKEPGVYADDSGNKFKVFKDGSMKSLTDNEVYIWDSKKSEYKLYKKGK